MNQPPSEEQWHVHRVRAGLPGLERLSGMRLPWLHAVIRPADIGQGLREAMLRRDTWLEDVNYHKVVPNHYMVEVHPQVYAQQFGPIVAQVTEQWRARLLDDLVTANSRLGRKEYRFGGQLRVEVRPSADVKESEARVLCRIEPDFSPPAAHIEPPRGAYPSVVPPLNPPPRGGMPPVGTSRNEPPRGEQPSVGTNRIQPPREAYPSVVPPMNPPSRGGMPSVGTSRNEPPRGGMPSVGTSQPLPPRGDMPSVGTSRNEPPRRDGTLPPLPLERQPTQADLSVTDKRRGLAVAFLEMLPGGQRWSLYPGDTTLGRSTVCQVYLDQAPIQEKRLVSGQHAYIHMASGVCTLYDGALAGRPSANGTFINRQRVPAGGQVLRSGDEIILAAADGQHPRVDTPGAAVFVFRDAGVDGPAGRERASGQEG